MLRTIVALIGLGVVPPLLLSELRAAEPPPAAAVAGPVAAVNESAPAENPHLWKTRTTSVAVFKNGMGFFMREGSTQTRDGWCVGQQVPPAAFGTFAIYSLNPRELVDVVGAGPGEIIDFDDSDAPSDPESKRSRLLGYQHLTVQLSYRQKGVERTAAGRMVSISPDFVVLDNDANSFAVPLAGITRLQVQEHPLRVHVTSEEAKAADAPQESRLGMAYLRHGITWIPEYTLKVLDDQTAELTLRGTLVNQAEDLVHCDVNFVVGVPHFAHSEYLTPIAVGQAIRAIGGAVAPQEVASQIMSRAAFANNGLAADQFDTLGAGAMPAMAEDGNLAAAVGNLPVLDGASSSDFTVYTKKDLTIRQGEKAIVTLFRKKIRYGHVYRWTLPDPMKHFLVLENDTDTAWTTGPALAVSGELPLSEDLLRYTPRGGKCELPVTSAINLAHDHAEVESARQLKEYSPGEQVNYDLVALAGTLKLRNFEPRAAEIVVTVPVPGKPLEASDEGVISVDTTQLKLLERTGSVRWRVKLEPNETKVLSYSYERYVPSR